MIIIIYLWGVVLTHPLTILDLLDKDFSLSGVGRARVVCCGVVWYVCVAELVCSKIHVQ